MNPLYHVAIIMDGNGRWGLKYKNSRNSGHKAGLKTVEKIIKETIKNKIKFLTLFAFSTENWSRTKDEIKGLMDLFNYYISRHLTEMISNGIRIKFLGSKDGLPDKIVDLINNATEKSAYNNKFFLNIGGYE